MLYWSYIYTIREVDRYIYILYIARITLIDQPSTVTSPSGMCFQPIYQQRSQELEPPREEKIGEINKKYKIGMHGSEQDANRIGMHAGKMYPAVTCYPD